jgi:hypothetical protein
MNREELERIDRESLIVRAHAAGIRRARLLTRPELIDELLRLDPSTDRAQLKRSRGFFGIARDLLARVVERGLHLPDAADRLRVALGETPSIARPEPQAVPTVTLAEIYAAQGHWHRAVDTLRRVLEAEPDHGPAKEMLDRLEAAAELDSVGAEELPPEPSRQPEIARSSELELEPEPASSREAEPREFCVAVPMEGGSVFVSWGLSRESRAYAGNAPTVVRVFVVSPSWEGPRAETRDLRCEPGTSEMWFHDLSDGDVVRVAIGMGDGDTFQSFVHAKAIELSTAGLVHWSLDGAVPLELEAPEWAEVADALARAARQA